MIAPALPEQRRRPLCAVRGLLPLDLICDWLNQLMKVEQAKRAIAVVVQDPQVILLAKIALNDKEVGAIALLSQSKWDFVR
jgi:hypothetical protein